MTRNKIILGLAMLVSVGLPALAEIDLSGSWASKNHEDGMERGAGPNPVDFAGLPLNDSGRAKALSFSQSIISEPERICWFQTQWHIAAGPFNLKIWNQTDPLTGKTVAWVIGGWETRAPMTIWMDGRPHPSENAPHTWMGFATGKWEGDMLTVYTTHIKTGWLRRNGLPESERATMVEHFIRHGNYMTHVSIVTDPVYMTEPLIKSEDLEFDTSESASWLWPCEPVVEVVRPKGVVPSYLPGENPFLHEFAQRWGLPYEPTRGGAETMYPEYRQKLKKMPIDK